MQPTDASRERKVTPRRIAVPNPVRDADEQIDLAAKHEGEMRRCWAEARATVEARNRALAAAQRKDRRTLADWIAGGQKGQQPDDEAEAAARHELAAALRLEEASRMSVLDAVERLEGVVRSRRDGLADALESSLASRRLAAVKSLTAAAEQVLGIEETLHSIAWIGGLGTSRPGAIQASATGRVVDVLAAVRDAIDPPEPSPREVEIDAHLGVRGDAA